jgi:hypothetical protein
MPRGRAFFGAGYGMGMGRRPWGFGRGMGNPYPFCRFFPWLPRWWWSGMYGPMRPYPYGPYGVPPAYQPYGAAYSPPYYY